LRRDAPSARRAEIFSIILLRDAADGLMRMPFSQRVIAFRLHSLRRFSLCDIAAYCFSFIVAHAISRKRLSPRHTPYFTPFRGALRFRR